MTAKENKEYHKRKSSEWEKKHKRWRTAKRKKYIRERYESGDQMKVARKHRYGMTHEDYKKRVKKQNNRCAVCRRKERHINPYTGKRQALAVDHDHRTNRVRALLCADCNRGIGLFNENPVLLLRVIKYLKKHKRVQW